MRGRRVDRCYGVRRAEHSDYAGGEKCQEQRDGRHEPDPRAAACSDGGRRLSVGWWNVVPVTACRGNRVFGMRGECAPRRYSIFGAGGCGRTGLVARRLCRRAD